MQLLDSWYGEYVGGTSNKFYFLQLYSDPADPNASVKLLAQHGRNGSQGQEQQRYASTDMNYAKTQFAKVRAEKIAKGYQAKATPAFCNSLVTQRTGVPASNVKPAPAPLVPPVEIPATGFAKMLADRSYIVQSRPPAGTLMALMINNRTPATLLRNPADSGAGISDAWVKELRLDQLRGFAGLAPLLVEGIVANVRDVAHFIPLDLLIYGGDSVAGYDFGSRWALLIQAIAELRGNAAGPALDRWILPEFVDHASLASKSPAALMLRHSSAPHGTESPLVQAA